MINEKLEAFLSLREKARNFRDSQIDEEAKSRLLTRRNWKIQPFSFIASKLSESERNSINLNEKSTLINAKQKTSLFCQRIKNCIQKYSDIQETQKKSFKFASFIIESTNYFIST